MADGEKEKFRDTEKTGDCRENRNEGISTNSLGRKNCSESAYRVYEHMTDSMAGDAAYAYMSGMTEADEKGRRKQGDYTISDYLSLPEDEHWELIDGHLIRLEAPAPLHQDIIGDLYYQLRQCLEMHPETECKVILSPVDVQLDMDDRTVVEPDLLILCDGNKRGRKRIQGAPDFIVEVISPSTRSRDMVLKNFKYRRAGVREYWIVDPEEKKVIVNLFTRDREEFISRIYDFKDQIPVGISSGECVIDFAKIERNLEDVYGKV